jgi:membrane associated rhomboid family serine protease
MIPIKDRNPTDLFPLVTISIIAANIAVFIYQISQRAMGFEHFTASFALVPAAFLATPFSPAQHVSIFISIFLHGGLIHIGGNMLFLWIFGNNIEDYFGHFKFAVFYLACGAVATLAHVFIHPHSSVPVIGASGAISGVLGAYFVLFPRARVLTLVPIFFFLYFVDIPAYFFLGVYIIFQFLNGLPSLAGGATATQGVAWFAHIGGFFAGIILLLILPRRKGFRSRIPR